MTRAEFKRATGRDPVDDDLDRTNCDMIDTTERCVHGEDVGDYCEDCDGGIPCAACGGLGRAGTTVCEECDGSGWWVYPLDLDPDWT